MTFKSNIPELIEKLERLKTAVGGNSGGIPTVPDFSDALFSALNAGMGKMKFRIFNKGMDADGNGLGAYTKQYGKRRDKAGRQIAYKDLEMEGSLRRSIEMARVDSKQVMIAITNEETALIAGYQEQQIANIRAGQNARTGTATPAQIFQLSQSEFEQTQDEADAAVDQVISKLFEA